MESAGGLKQFLKCWALLCLASARLIPSLFFTGVEVTIFPGWNCAAAVSLLLLINWKAEFSLGEKARLLSFWC